MFSLPSSETQSPRSRCSTFRVGLDVIGTSYWQELKAREQRPIATATPRCQAKSMNSRSLARIWEPAFVEIDQVWNALNIVAIGDSNLLFPLFETRRDGIAPAELRCES